MGNQHIFLASPHMSDEGYELDYVHAAFEQNYIAPLGVNVDTMEHMLEEYLSAEHVVALSAGTAALHLAMILCGVGTGDYVFCQDVTFSATANAIAYCGGTPVFIDSEPDTWNMSPDALRRAFEQYRVPKAVVVVHLYGTPAKLDELCAICKEYGVPLIEDAAEALGSEYHGKKCGTFGQFGVLSFNGNKIITTSGGGALICQTKQQADHVLKLATQAREPVAWYEHKEIGYNYRLSNVSAGIGCGQMKVLDQRVAQKQAIYRQYCEKLADLPATMAREVEGTVPNRWLSVLLIDRGQSVTPADVIETLKQANIDARNMWKPMHMQPVFRNCPFVASEEHPVGEDLFARGVCLPSDTKMDAEDVERVCAVIRSLF